VFGDKLAMVTGKSVTGRLFYRAPMCGTLLGSQFYTAGWAKGTHASLSEPVLNVLYCTQGGSKNVPARGGGRNLFKVYKKS